MTTASPWAVQPKPEIKLPPIVGIAIAALAWVSIVLVVMVVV